MSNISPETVDIDTFYFCRRNKIMRRVLCVLISLFMVFSLVGCGSKEEPSKPDSGRRVIKVGMECDYAPNNWLESAQTDTNLPVANNNGFYAEGYDVMMAKAIGEMLDADIEIYQLEWSGLIPALNEGTIDLIIAGMADTENRKQSINFSQFYSVHETIYCLVVRANSAYADKTGISQFGGATVQGQINTQYDTVIDQIEGVNHIEGAKTVPVLISNLDQGVVDAIVLDTETAEAQVKGYGDEFKIIYLDANDNFDIGFTGGCIGVRFSDEALLAEVNAALAKISTETRQQMNDTAIAKMPN